jgi:hypothetical protein
MLARKLFLKRPISSREFHDLMLAIQEDHWIKSVERSTKCQTLKVHFGDGAEKVGKPLANVIFFLSSKNLLDKSGLDNGLDEELKAA